THTHTHTHTHRGATGGQEVEKSFSNQKVRLPNSSIHCRSVLEQDTEPLIAPDVQCAISVKMCIHCKSLWIKASAKCNVKMCKYRVGFKPITKYVSYRVLCCQSTAMLHLLLVVPEREAERETERATEREAERERQRERE